MEPIPFDTQLISGSLDETERLAARFYRMIAPNALVALYGELGAGKTCFVRGVAKAAGVDPDEVNSPSFTIINEYPAGKTPIFHFDLYRLTDPSEFHSIGGDDYLERDGIIMIEWAGNGEGFIPRRRYNVTLEIVDADRRRLVFSKEGI